MRYHNYPAGPSTLGPFTIYVDGAAQSRWLRGGDGNGSDYYWSLMVPQPGCASTTAQRQAIGALTHDAGVSVGMRYTASSSTAYTTDSAGALVATFGYSNAIAGYNGGSTISKTTLNTMLNTNLDAGLPCLLAVRSSVSGHAVVCDGYGYSGSTLYHHLNLGWSGADDAWYDLPGVETGKGTYDTVTSCIYNVFPSGSGEVISGRVTDSSGNPLSGVAVTASFAGWGSVTTVTNTGGIYAFAGVPSNRVCTVQASEEGRSFASVTVTTGKSASYQAGTGNVWAADFVQLPDSAAELTNVSVTPPEGTSCDEYHFSVYYHDAERDAPASGSGQLLLRGASSVSLVMALESGTPADGVYGCRTRLRAGAYNFRIVFADTGGGATAATPWQSGPYVSLCSDMNGDSIVNFFEFAGVMMRWHQQPCNEYNSWCAWADVDRSGGVGDNDLAFLRSEWMIRPAGGGPAAFHVAASSFLMGDAADGSHAAELPVRRVSLDSFSIGRYEVTNAEYCAGLNMARAAGLVQVVSGVVRGTGNNQPYCDTSSSSSLSRIVWNGSSFSVVAGKEAHPVTMVTWMGAAAYCNWRSAMELRRPCYDLNTWSCDFTADGYRLPTEAEWECAARGGLEGLRYPWGNSSMACQLNTGGSGDPYESGTAPCTTPCGFYSGALHYKSDFNWPGSATAYQTSAGACDFWIYDLAGNVHEWCNDWYSESYYSTRPDPDLNPTGPAAGSARAVRGGSWMDGDLSSCRVSWRTGVAPGARSCAIGFRVATGGM
jgi:formylglycine-generating enzyme required for sulfatase activity